MTGSRFQLISISVSCIRRLCPVIEPAVSSTPKSGKGIHIISRSRYVAPLPMHHSPTASSNIPYRSVPGWKVMALYFVTFAFSMFRRKRLMNIFSAPCSHSVSCDPTTPSSAYNNPIHLTTAHPNPLCVNSWSSAVIAIHFLTTFSTIKLNRVGKMSPPWVVPRFSLECGPWYPFWRVTTSC